MTVVGIIGLGEIGRGLMTALVPTDFELAVCDIRPEALRPYAERATGCADPAALGALADVVLVSVVDDRQVLDVLEGPSGALSTLRPATTVVIISTIGIDTLRTVSEGAGRQGVGLVDCGVSGGPAAAASGQWVSMVGGDDRAVEAARPVLDIFSSLVVGMGPLGSGMRAKLARQVVQFGSWLAAYEAQRLAESAGIELAKLAQVIKESDAVIGGPSALMWRSTAAPFGPDDDRGLVAAMGTAAALAHKDLGAARALADELGISVPMIELTDASMDRVFGIAPVSPAEEQPRNPPSADRDRGMERMAAVYGFNADPDTVEGDFLAYTVDHLFGDVWSRPAMGTRERRLLTIGVLAAQGQIDLVEVQFAAALANGELTTAQVRESAIHLAHYAGWALGAKVSNVAESSIARYEARYQEARPPRQQAE